MVDNTGRFCRSPDGPGAVEGAGKFYGSAVLREASALEEATRCAACIRENQAIRTWCWCLRVTARCNSQIKREAEELRVADRVRLLGFVNQSELPSVYRSSDVLVLPSEYEPFGVVVNEALLCGCVAAVSDRVGAGGDLIRPDNGFIFPCGDVDRLAQILHQIVCNPGILQKMSDSSQKLLARWSPVENIQAYVEALNRVTLSRRTV